MWPWVFLGLGLVWLVCLRWLRDRYRGWVKERFATRVFFGYVAPLLGCATIFLSLGMMWRADGSQTVTNMALLICMLLGLLCLVAALAAIWGARLPRGLLPRWLRDDAGQLNAFLGRDED